MERFPVDVVAIDNVMSNVVFIKLDAEGQEKVILLATSPKHWEAADMIVEVGSTENALALCNHLTSLGVNLFSQKLNWKKVASLDGMPSSYKEGSLFISKKLEMPWAQ